MAEEGLTWPERFVRSGLAQGLSGREMLRQYRAAGGAIRTYVFQRLVAETQLLRSLQPVHSTAPLNRRPLAGEIAPITTRHARGYRYDVQVFVRQRGEDRVFTRPITLRSDQLRSYGHMIDQAVDAFVALAEQSDQVVYGAEVIGLQEMIPGGEG